MCASRAWLSPYVARTAASPSSSRPGKLKYVRPSENGVAASQNARV